MTDPPGGTFGDPGGTSGDPEGTVPTPTPHGMPSPKRQVGRYQIMRQIGRGGMATVYLARQTQLERNVALKELSTFHASAPEFAERFLRESRLAGSLNHPNIVTVFEYFEEGGTPYIAMEYVERDRSVRTSGGWCWRSSPAPWRGSWRASPTRSRTESSTVI